MDCFGYIRSVLSGNFDSRISSIEMEIEELRKIIATKTNKRIRKNKKETENAE